MTPYDRIADWYCRHRRPEVGAAEVLALAARLPTGAHVLDLGCGDGIPVTRILRGAGCAVEGLDGSRVMLTRYRARFPDAPTTHVRLEDADFPDASYDAVVAWGVLFHLEAEAQRALLARLADWLVPGGWLLFTAAAEAGARVGEMAGETFRYVSLGRGGYRATLAGASLRLVHDYGDPDENWVYLAQRVG